MSAALEAPTLFAAPATFRVEWRDEMWCVVHELSGLKALVALDSQAYARRALTELAALPINWSSIRETPSRFAVDGVSRTLAPESMALLRDLQYRCATNGGCP